MIQSLFCILIYMCYLFPLLSLNVAENNLWRKKWFPFAVVDDLDPNKVHSSTLLGKKLVYWKHPKGWSIAEDQCPHRLAPLSQGYLEKGTGDLTCRFHGWSFNGTGACTCIPQTTRSEPLSNSRARLQTFPLQEKNGLLWFWPENESLDGSTTLEAMKHPLPWKEEFKDTIFIMKEFPEDYDVLTEVAFDPSHANFLHHSQKGFFRKDATPILNYSLINDVSEDGFNLEHSTYTKKSNTEMNATREFIAPSTVFVQYDKYTNPSTSFYAILYFIPMMPGFTKVLGTITLSDKKPRFLTRAFITCLKMLGKMFPKYLIRSAVHSIDSTIEDQDISVIHHQKLALQQEEAQGNTWRKKYFLPSKADFGTLTFRKWYDQFSNGQVGWLQKPLSNFAPKLSEKQLMDRWNRHTSHCYSCQRTLKLISNTVKVINFATFATVLFLIYEWCILLSLEGSGLKLITISNPFKTIAALVTLKLSTLFLNNKKKAFYAPSSSTFPNI